MILHSLFALFRNAAGAVFLPLAESCYSQVLESCTPVFNKKQALESISKNNPGQPVAHFGVSYTFFRCITLDWLSFRYWMNLNPCSNLPLELTFHQNTAAPTWHIVLLLMCQGYFRCLKTIIVFQCVKCNLIICSNFYIPLIIVTTWRLDKVMAWTLLTKIWNHFLLLIIIFPFLDSKIIRSLWKIRRAKYWHES